MQATALRLGEEAAAKLERELDQVREEERKQAEERKREEEKRMSARPGPFQGEMLELSHDRQANTPKWVRCARQMAEAMRLSVDERGRQDYEGGRSRPVIRRRGTERPPKPKAPTEECTT